MLQNNPILKSKIDQLWNKFWAGGIANLGTAIEQITCLPVKHSAFLTGVRIFKKVLLCVLCELERSGREIKKIRVKKKTNRTLHNHQVS